MKNKKIMVSVGLDFVLSALAFWVGFYLRFSKYGDYFNTKGYIFRQYIILFIIWLISWFLLAILFSVYKNRFSSFQSIKRIIMASLLNLFVAGTFAFYYNKIYSFSRAFLLIATVLLLVFQVGIRYLSKGIRARTIKLRYLHKKRRILEQLNKRRERQYQSFLLLLDVLLISLAFIGAFYLRFHTNIFPPPRKIAVFSEQLYKLWFINLIFIVAFFIEDLYRLKYKSFFDLLWSTGKGIILSVLIIVFLTYFSNTRYKAEWAGVIIVASGTIFILDILVRFLVWRIYIKQAALKKDRILIIGAGKTGVMVNQRIKRAGRVGREVVGFLDDNTALQGKKIDEVEVLGKIDELEKVIKQKNVNNVIVAIPSLPKERLGEIIKVCNTLLVPYSVTSDIFSIVLTSLQVSHLEGLMLLAPKTSPLERVFNRLAKRIFDIVFAGVLLLLLLPVMLLIAILIKLDSKGPIFYKQIRLTENRRPFKAIKFRSMYVDRVFENGTPWTEEEDPRITRVGRFLRKYSLDELPQLINVLVGDMSIVGPRALALEDEKYFDSPFFRLRYKVKAGLTGWAQVHGLRGGHRFIEERTRFDLWYIENWSLLLDIKIIFMTIAEVLFGSNAY